MMPDDLKNAIEQLLRKRLNSNSNKDGFEPPLNCEHLEYEELSKRFDCWLFHPIGCFAMPSEMIPELPDSRPQGNVSVTWGLEEGYENCVTAVLMWNHKGSLEFEIAYFGFGDLITPLLW